MAVYCTLYCALSPLRTGEPSVGVITSGTLTPVSHAVSASDMGSELVAAAVGEAGLTHGWRW